MIKFKPMPAPEPRETYAELVERLRMGRPPARPMVDRILTDPPRRNADVTPTLEDNPWHNQMDGVRE